MLPRSQQACNYKDSLFLKNLQTSSEVAIKEQFTIIKRATTTATRVVEKDSHFCFVTHLFFLLKKMNLGNFLLEAQVMVARAHAFLPSSHVYDYENSSRLMIYKKKNGGKGTSLCVGMRME